MLEKNKVFRTKIDSINSSGFGVCRIDGIVVFVNGAVTGDEAEIKIIKTKKNYAVGRIEKLIRKSSVRQEVDCDSFRNCGGCVYRHINYESEKEIKAENVINAFKRIGHIDVEIEQFIGAEEQNHYRNKAQYKLEKENGVLKIGFYAPRTHSVTDCRDCLLQPEIFSDIVESISYWIKKNNISVYDEKTHTGILRHIYLRIAETTGEIMVCVVVNGNILPHSESFVSELKEKYNDIKSIAVNYNSEKTNVILGDRTEIIYGQEYITDVLCGVEVRLSPQSFYQVNRVQAEKLYNKAKEYASLTGKENVIDLYCGAGTIGLSLADKAGKITGVEIVEQAVENAKENALRNGIENAEFICAKAEDAAEILLERGEKIDVVIVDPPRKGLAPELIETINKMNPERVVYVSCDVATLARDCEIFREKGYLVNKVSAVDLFPRTAHVESCALLCRT